MRINKYLAECGIASRRNSEKYVIEKRVKVNGKIVTDLAFDIDPYNDAVAVDGKKISRQKRHIYIMLNKPKGVVTTTNDDRGRKTVTDIVKSSNGRRIFPVGRLDYDTEGLLIMTSDGDLANRLMHPSHEIPKTYVANVEGTVTEVELNQLRTGVEVEGRVTSKATARIIETAEGYSRVELTITEGRNRQIRKMFEAIGRRVDFLKRTKIGDLRLGGLYRGEYRELTPSEVEYLKNV